MKKYCPLSESLIRYLIKVFLCFQEPVVLDNKKFRELTDFHTRNKNVTWVSKLAKAKINISDSEFNTFQDKGKRPKQDLGESLEEGKFSNGSKPPRTTEIILDYSISSHISYNEDRSTFSLLPDLLQSFEDKEHSELPQVLVISE